MIKILLSKIFIAFIVLGPLFFLISPLTATATPKEFLEIIRDDVMTASIDQLNPREEIFRSNMEYKESHSHNFQEYNEVVKPYDIKITEARNKLAEISKKLDQMEEHWQSTGEILPSQRNILRQKEEQDKILTEKIAERAEAVREYQAKKIRVANTATRAEIDEQIENENFPCSITAGISGCIPLAIKKMGELIAQILIWVLGGAKYLFDFVFNYTVKDFQSLANTDAVISIWTKIRDLVNVAIIFIMLYVGIGTILNLSSVNTSRMIIGVLVAALLVNFSALMVKTVIDIPNTAAVVINRDHNPIDEIIMGYSGPVLNLETKATKAGQTSPEKGGFGSMMVAALAIAFGKVLFTITMIIVVLTGAIMLIYRAVLLVFMIALSPIMVLGLFVPQIKKYGGQYLSFQYLISNALFAPIFFLLISIPVSLTRLPKPADAAGAIGLYGLIIVSTLAVLYISKSLGVAGGEWAGKGLAKAQGWVKAGTVGSAMRGGRFLGAQTAGRAATRMAHEVNKRDWLGRGASHLPFGNLAADWTRQKTKAMADKERFGMKSHESREKGYQERQKARIGKMDPNQKLEELEKLDKNTRAAIYKSMNDDEKAKLKNEAIGAGGSAADMEKALREGAHKNPSDQQKFEGKIASLADRQKREEETERAIENLSTKIKTMSAQDARENMEKLSIEEMKQFLDRFEVSSSGDFKDKDFAEKGLLSMSPEQLRGLLEDRRTSNGAKQKIRSLLNDPAKRDQMTKDHFGSAEIPAASRISNFNELRSINTALHHYIQSGGHNESFEAKDAKDLWAEVEGGTKSITQFVNDPNLKTEGLKTVGLSRLLSKSSSLVGPSNIFSQLDSHDIIELFKSDFKKLNMTEKNQFRTSLKNLSADPKIQAIINGPLKGMI